MTQLRKLWPVVLAAGVAALAVSSQAATADGRAGATCFGKPATVVGQGIIGGTGADRIPPVDRDMPDKCQGGPGNDRRYFC